MLHCGAGVLHRVERLLVDVGRLDRVDFALQRHYLALGLLERVIELLLTPQRGLGSCNAGNMAVSTSGSKATGRQAMRRAK